MFEIDFKRLFAIILPGSMRVPLVYCILRAAGEALEFVYQAFLSARSENVFRLTHNGQVCYLRCMLCDKFGPGFSIQTAEAKGQWLYAITEEGREILLATTEKGGRGEVPVLTSEQLLNMAQNDFIVVCPADAYDSRMAEIQAMVERYKLPTKQPIYLRNGGQFTDYTLNHERYKFEPIVELSKPTNIITEI